MLALGFGPGHAGAHALADKGALKLRQRGHDVENQLARGRGRVDVFLVGDEVHAQALEFLQRVDQRLDGAGEAVVAPDQHRVELPFLGGGHHAFVLGPFLAGTRGLVDVFFDDGEAPPLGILAQRPQLRLWVLPFVEGGDAGVEGHARGLVGRFGGHRGYQKGNPF